MGGRSDNHDALRRTASRFRWISRIEAPEAPGYDFFAAEVHAADFGHPESSWPVASLSGKGTTMTEAFEGCVGEGIEHLSRLEWGDETVTRGRPDEVNHGHDAGTLDKLMQLLGPDLGNPTPPLDWMQGLRLSDETKVLLPADLCLRRIPGRGTCELPSAISTGCAAGSTRDGAVLAALLELAERDAAALWWNGGRPARAVGLETLARSGAAEIVSGLRGKSRQRSCWLLDITTNLGIPCFAAVSVDRDGRGFASGAAADLAPRRAIRRALLELCQIELGHHIVAAKRQVRGEAALNASDRRKLRRSRVIDAHSFQRLYPAAPPQLHEDHRGADPADSIAAIIGRFQAIGIEPLVIDLTRPGLGAFAVRALAPGLQPFPSSVVTDRLKQEKGHAPSRTEPADIPLY